MLTRVSDLPVLKSALGFLGLYIFIKLIFKINRGFQVRRLAAAQGCGAAPKWKTYDPIFGLDHLWTIYKDYTTHKFLDATTDRFLKIRSNTIVYSTLWGPPTISTIEPENLKTILATKFKDFNIDHNRKEGLKAIFGEGIFASDGAYWQHSRELLKPTFARAKIDDPTFLETHAEDLMKAIALSAEGGKVIDLQPLFSSASLDIITEFLLGESARSLDPEKRRNLNAGGKKTEAEEFYDAFSYIISSINGQNSKYGVLGMFLPDFSFKKHKKIMDTYIDGIINNAIADEKAFSSNEKDDSNHRFTFLSDVVKSTQDRPRLRAELLNILLAGRDTTESFMSSLFFTLSQRPDIFRKLQAEIDAADIPLTPSFSQLKSLPYLRACLNEVQRLYPSAPENDRQAITDTTLPLGGGADGKSPVFVKKNAVVHWSVFAMHRRKDLFGDDSYEFRPERWLDGPEGKGLRVSWEYIPFNGGPRVCIGQQFALMEVSYLACRLVREFDIWAEEKRVWEEKATIVATVNGGVKVRVQARK